MLQTFPHSKDTVITFIALLYKHYKCITVAMIWYILRIWMHLCMPAFPLSVSYMKIKRRRSEWVYFLLCLFHVPSAARGRLANPTWGEYRVLTDVLYRKSVYFSMVWYRSYFLLLIVLSRRVFVWHLEQQLRLLLQLFAAELKSAAIKLSVSLWKWEETSNLRH